MGFHFDIDDWGEDISKVEGVEVDSAGEGSLLDLGFEPGRERGFRRAVLGTLEKPVEDTGDMCERGVMCGGEIGAGVLYDEEVVDAGIWSVEGALGSVRMSDSGGGGGGP